MKVFRVQDNCGLWTVRHYEHLSFSCRLFNYKVETFRFLEGNYDHFLGLEVFIGGPSLFILKSVAEDRVNVFIQCPYCETVGFPNFYIDVLYISIKDCRYIQLSEMIELFGFGFGFESFSRISNIRIGIRQCDCHLIPL